MTKEDAPFALLVLCGMLIILGSAWLAHVAVR